jgi:ubiquinol-cytochrome c reductase iron-sulfur subunit
MKRTLTRTYATGPQLGYEVEEEETRHGNVGGQPTKRTFAYLVMGSSAFVYAAAIRSTVVDFVQTLAPSADVLALASIEVDLAKIPEGQGIVTKWRGKPIFIRHRTEVRTVVTVLFPALRD